MRAWKMWSLIRGFGCKLREGKFARGAFVCYECAIVGTEAGLAGSAQSKFTLALATEPLSDEY